MSGPFEKYVEQAAEVLAPHVQVWRIWDHEERAVCLGCDWTSETEGHELSAAWALHMATLAIPAVGPLIEEDARDRMVTAAGKALERDGGGDLESVRGRLDQLWGWAKAGKRSDGEGGEYYLMDVENVDGFTSAVLGILATREIATREATP